ncbi:hypothetical protein TRVL_10128 [Trypanosoma vivax]|nr:hypothetical protein TRVL_10128 [Trypanosoma vivax]
MHGELREGRMENAMSFLQAFAGNFMAQRARFGLPKHCDKVRVTAFIALTSDLPPAASRVVGWHGMLKGRHTSLSANGCGSGNAHVARLCVACKHVWQPGATA